MDQAINAYYTITASPEFCEIERLREKARHDEAQALYHAKLEVKIQIAEKLIGLGLPLDQIAMATGLSQEDIKHLVP